MNIKTAIKNNIKLLIDSKYSFSEFLKKNYSILIGILAIVLISYLVYLFIRYDYLVINKRIEPETDTMKLETVLLNQVVEKIKEKNNIKESNTRNPFLP